jgi:hypothetical protein
MATLLAWPSSWIGMLCPPRAGRWCLRVAPRGVHAQPRRFELRPRARAMRAIVRPARGRAKAHSQMRRTVQPDARKARVTARSRCAFLASFGAQYSMREVGTRPWRGQPCQKQPSTNTATFSAGNTKSGLPGSGAPRRQPLMRCPRSSAIVRSSVSRFPRERMSDMTAERLTLVNTSAMRECATQSWGPARCAQAWLALSHRS